ncbi:MAG: serine--tRNA ligase, partial [bacterium]|nr:serine--tRNA ligase [bacterium]
MLDIKFIRENKEIVQAGAKKKHIKFSVDELIAVDDKRRELLASIEDKRRRQNEVSERMPAIFDSAEKGRLLGEMKELKDILQKQEEKLKAVMKEWQTLMLAVPNIPDISVPEGSSDADNLEVKLWGEKPKFAFEPKGHIDLMQGLGMIDLERGAKVAGFRGYFLKGAGALLSFAAWRFAFDHFLKKDFEPMIVPSLVRKENLLGSGYLPQGDEDLYKTQDGDYLAGTAEVA